MYKRQDKYTPKLVLAWVRKNLENCTEPRQYGKGLTADRSGQWRYRAGDYRLIAQIEDDRVIILLLAIGHREKVYDI